MFDLCQNGDLEKLKPLLEASDDKNPKNPTAGRNETLLHQAAAKGHLEIVKFLVPLLENKTIPNDNAGLAPIHYAAKNDQVEVVKYFCHQLQVKNPKTSTGWTLLHYAAMHGQVEVVKYLSLNVQDKHPKFLEKTPLDYARLRGHLEVVKVLQHGVDDFLDSTKPKMVHLDGFLLVFCSVYLS